MEDRKFLIASLTISFLLIFGAVVLLSKNETSSVKRVDSAILVGDGRHFEGKEDAKVVIVEFSDFQCPACKAAYSEMKKVLEAYKDKVKIIYRDYPLVSIHQYSQQAANAAEFAAENGKFWEWHDLMFTNQDFWASAVDDKKLEELFGIYAKSLGLDGDKMVEAVRTNKYNDKIQKDISDGDKSGLTGTPTIFVNGEQANGYSFEEIKNLIDKNLK